MKVKSTEPWRFIPSKERLEKMFTYKEETFEEENLNELFLLLDIEYMLIVLRMLEQ